MLEKIINYPIEEETTKIITKEIEVENSLKLINFSQEKENKNYDYKVNIQNTYIISINSKVYITIRKKQTTRSNWYTLATGRYNVDIYRYYDALNLNENGKYNYLHEYRHGHFDKNRDFLEKTIGEKPEFERHILEICPQLNCYEDNYVPNTCLKRIYQEYQDIRAAKNVNNIEGKKIKTHKK